MRLIVREKITKIPHPSIVNRIYVKWKNTIWYRIRFAINKCIWIKLLGRRRGRGSFSQFLIQFSMPSTRGLHGRNPSPPLLARSVSRHFRLAQPVCIFPVHIPFPLTISKIRPCPVHSKLMKIDPTQFI